MVLSQMCYNWLHFHGTKENVNHVGKTNGRNNQYNNNTIQTKLSVSKVNENNR